MPRAPNAGDLKRRTAGRDRRHDEEHDHPETRGEAGERTSAANPSGDEHDHDEHEGQPDQRPVALEIGEGVRRSRDAADRRARWQGIAIDEHLVAEPHPDGGAGVTEADLRVVPLVRPASELDRGDAAVLGAG